MNDSTYLSTFIALVLLVPIFAHATIGVGVTTGEISVDDPINPGEVSKLPPVTVVNTGDEVSSYSMSIQYHADREEMRPEKKWFRFSPKTFELEPGETQPVQIRLDIPVQNTRPGDYFAFLEARPAEKSESPAGTSVGIAAATKLNFSIAPANILEGIYYRLRDTYFEYTPWTHIVSGIIAFTAFILFARRFVSLEISLKNEEDEKGGDEREDRNNDGGEGADQDTNTQEENHDENKLDLKDG